MARRGDSGAYVIGNVDITLGIRNLQDIHPNIQEKIKIGRAYKVGSRLVELSDREFTLNALDNSMMGY